MRCIAVDDEPLALEKLKSFIERMPQLQLVGIFYSATDAIAFLKANKVDLVFLDIKMEGISGIEMVSQLSDPPMIIFSTAYQEFATQAFDLSVTDYLLKPYGFGRFSQAVKRAEEYQSWRQLADKQKAASRDFIFVKSGYRLVKVVLNEVLYLEGMRDFICIVTTGEKVIASVTFHELEKILPSGFVRCHKSYLVSLSKIDSVENDRITVGKKIIPIGDVWKERFYSSLSF